MIKIIGHFSTQEQYEIFMKSWNGGSSNIGNQLTDLKEILMTKIEELAVEVHANTDVAHSAVALINGFSARLDAAIAAHASGDAAALTAFADEVRTSKNELAAAVVANTPAAPPVVIPAPPAASTEAPAV